jgi:prephenate dehydratase
MTTNSQIKKIGYQGIEGSFSHLTLKKILNTHIESFELVSCFSFIEMFQKLESNSVDYILIPLENSLAGSVVPNYDLLIDYTSKFLYETYTEVNHQLIAKPGSSIANLTKVYSHPKALEQCQEFFKQYPHLEKIEYTDTASSVKMISKSYDPNFAAIASKEAAEAYGCEILAKNIQDDQNNWTRFILATKTDNQHVLDLKTELSKAKHSLILKLSHQVGSLSKVLEILANKNYNLTKIESRPKKGSFFEYYFFVDFEDHKDQKFDKTELLPFTTECIDLGQYFEI